MGIKIANAVLAVVFGVLGAVVLFWVLDKLSALGGKKGEERVKPYLYLLPALAAISLFLLYPAITTIQASFANADTSKYVGLQNYTQLLGNRDFQTAILNNFLWILVVPASVVALGLLVATLADRLSPGAEKLSKTIIFLPMAISMAGAGTIWALIYAFKPAGTPQTGLLNAIVTAFGGQPQTWLQFTNFKFNVLLLMVVYIWTQVGYAMVLLSSAIKAVPEDTIEAGRIDGAGEKRIFFSIIVPQVWPTVVTVFITVLIGVLKVFDIVYVMTNGQFDTNVVGNAFFSQLFINMDNGKAAAIVVMLMIVIVPIMVYQVRQFRLQEAQR
ncbi:carbohydrate ABC transporter permease [Arsenicicoccus sp. oral taxon 190]|uniref:carbohydrate ABC transporter permease n=1 Tax=Arsenicicoccus sp. oral taxon 190 TaxID=1658671 RepID=UPI000679FCA0|nr:sugar ABC transporter permease [Arsenicicoccus sp. oral taxon 190]AKT51326.1 sugar ABC transporter permease [Arsenicicoccus sp. oral taxon 190]